MQNFKNLDAQISSNLDEMEAKLNASLSPENDQTMKASGEMSGELVKEKGLSFLDLIKAFIIVAIFLVLFLPVIYLRNEIYYISRDIESLKTEHSVLKEENTALERKIEALKFKHEILDPLSVGIE